MNIETLADAKRIVDFFGLPTEIFEDSGIEDIKSMIEFDLQENASVALLNVFEKIESINVNLQDYDQRFVRLEQEDDLPEYLIRKMKEKDLVEYANKIGVVASTKDLKKDTLKKVLQKRKFI